MAEPRHDSGDAAEQCDAVLRSVDEDVKRVIKTLFRISAISKPLEYRSADHTKRMLKRAALIFALSFVVLPLTLIVGYAKVSKVLCFSLQGTDINQTVSACQTPRVANTRIFGPGWALLNFGLAIMMFTSCAVLVYK